MLHKHYIQYMRIVNYFFRDSRFMRLMLCLRSETRILKEGFVQKADCFRLIAMKQHLTETAVRRCSSNKVILRIPQNS